MEKMESKEFLNAKRIEPSHGIHFPAISLLQACSCLILSGVLIASASGKTAIVIVEFGCL